MTSDVQISGFFPPTGAPQSVNVVSPLPDLLRKRRGLERMLKQVNRDIEFLERKQSLAEFVAADRINSGRVDIPTLAEIVEWDVRYRAEYREAHQARNKAFEALTHVDEGRPTENDAAVFKGNAKEVETHVEGELADAEAQVDNDRVERLAFSRGAGYEAAEPLVGQREPRLSTLYLDGGVPDTDVLAWWAGAYQRIGLL